jgi:hypothetical protein
MPTIQNSTLSGTNSVTNTRAWLSRDILAKGSCPRAIGWEDPECPNVKLVDWREKLLRSVEPGLVALALENVWEELVPGRARIFAASLQMQLSDETGRSGVAQLITSTSLRSGTLLMPLQGTASEHRPKRMRPMTQLSRRLSGSWCRRMNRPSMEAVIYPQPRTIQLAMAVVQ